ncbi:unnamed protein product [Clonostachys solani]|uniref:50S ribosomal protein L1 n=1 Tax=Clonostachys solani TaxID=160281 RepID=A0A9N9YRA3_9HYPO|nr:unnamed protein product [Clonostachys solani]
MAPMDRCLASMARLSLAHPARPTLSAASRCLAPGLLQTQKRTYASVVRIRQKTKKKKAVPKDFKRHRLDKTEFPQFSLVEAMRVLRACEVGKPPGGVKYELSVNLKTFRNGPVIKSSIRLPNPVQSDWQIAVICPEGSAIANDAINAGAKAVGENTLFEAIKNETIEFDRLICHESSEKALQQANLGRILGPKGLMPNKKMGTIVTDVVRSIRDSAGAADYRERMGVIRMAIGQLGHTPVQLKANIEAVMKKIKTQCAELSEDVPKDVHEVILSTTNGPGLSLNGKLKNLEDKTLPEAVSGQM